MADRDFRAELDAFYEALTTQFKDMTDEQHDLLVTSPLLEVAGKTLDSAATFAALRAWLDGERR